MVMDVACGPMAYKTQILAYHSRRKPIVDFCDGTKKSDLDDIDKECEDLMMLRFSNTKSNMLYNLLRVWTKRRGLNWISY